MADAGQVPHSTTIREQAAELRAEAKAQREAMFDKAEETLTRIGLDRDGAARNQYIAEREAKSAAMQVARERRAGAEAREEAARLETAAAHAEHSGRTTEAAELREDAAGALRSAANAERRATQAERDAAELERAAIEHGRTVEALEQRGSEVERQVEAAEAQLDRLDDQARLLDQAANMKEGVEHVNTSEFGEVLLPDVRDTLERVRTMAIDAGDIVDITGRPVRTPALTRPLDSPEAAAPDQADPPPLVERMRTALPDAATLRSQADVLRAEAEAQRKEVLDEGGEKVSQIGLDRDRAARDQYGAEEGAKSAALQVARERRAAAELHDEADELENQAAAAEREGRSSEAEELRERASGRLRQSASAERRADQALREHEDLNVAAVEHQRTVVMLELRESDLERRMKAAETQLDRLEDQAQLLEDASQKMLGLEYIEAMREEYLRDGFPPGIDRLRFESEHQEVRGEAVYDVTKLIDRVRATDIDYGAIRDVSDRPVRTVPLTTSQANSIDQKPADETVHLADDASFDEFDDLGFETAEEAIREAVALRDEPLELDDAPSDEVAISPSPPSAVDTNVAADPVVAPLEAESLHLPVEDPLSLAVGDPAAERPAAGDVEFGDESKLDSGFGTTEFEA